MNQYTETILRGIKVKSNGTTSKVRLSKTFAESMGITPKKRGRKKQENEQAS